MCQEVGDEASCVARIFLPLMLEEGARQHGNTVDDINPALPIIRNMP